MLAPRPRPPAHLSARNYPYPGHSSFFTPFFPFPFSPAIEMENPTTTMGEEGTVSVHHAQPETAGWGLSSERKCRKNVVCVCAFDLCPSHAPLHIDVETKYYLIPVRVELWG